MKSGSKPKMTGVSGAPATCMYNLRSTASRQATEMELHTGGIRMEAFSTTKDAGLWLRKLENFCKLKGWKDEQIVAAFPLYLSDSAVLWYDSLPQQTQNTCCPWS